MKIELLHLSAALEEKKQILQKALADKENNAHKLQQEIEVISYKYNRLQKQSLETSTVGKKLISLTKKIGLRTPNSLLTNMAFHNDGSRQDISPILLPTKRGISQPDRIRISILLSPYFWI